MNNNGNDCTNNDNHDNNNDNDNNDNNNHITWLKPIRVRGPRGSGARARVAHSERISLHVVRGGSQAGWIFFDDF